MRWLAFLWVAALAYAQGSIREEQTLEVNGVREVWRLEWKSAPKPFCNAGDPTWYTCPCMGFAFAESGLVDLVRVRQGHEVERLALTPLFEGAAAILQRWPTTDKDMDDPESAALSAMVGKRQAVKIMQFTDYDRDGKATEFYLHTSSGPCGHTQGVVVGVSSSNARLHVFGSAAHPDKPLVLQKLEWDALVKSREAVHVVDWNCGDHGAMKQVELQLQGSPRGIDVVRETYACPRGDKARPVKQEPQ